MFGSLVATWLKEHKNKKLKFENQNHQSGGFCENKRSGASAKHEAGFCENKRSGASAKHEAGFCENKRSGASAKHEAGFCENKRMRP
ncbi:hypothetical protein [Campylobacter hyointestinalis]|uniref:hypothetical protein n=1 Tax=Campylobacter hyointestinalis TaxID=198 RepID=UPI001BD3EDAC|nr:hypothetical protein [Campylobacter hyointestinalis]MBT0612655.1 hypothetical protein [Campylobacter hyointestinalis subsp. hyointestinalis]